MKQSLFSLGMDFKALYDLANDVSYDHETGEVIDESEALKALFEDVQSELETKLDNTAYIIKELLSDAETIKAERERLHKRQTALTNKAELLKSLMLSALNSSGQTKIKTLAHTFSTRSSSSVEADESQLSREYLRIKYEADKKKIGEALKSGVSVNGAKMVDKVTLIIK